MTAVHSETTTPWYAAAGANVGEQCENLLASSEWQQISTTTYQGLVHRLELMTRAGLPKMKVISVETIETLGRIPRSTEGMLSMCWKQFRKQAKEIIVSRMT